MRARRGLSSVGGSGQDCRGVEEAAPCVPILSLLVIFRGQVEVSEGPRGCQRTLQGFRWFGVVFQQVGERGRHGVSHIGPLSVRGDGAQHNGRGWG